MPPLNVEDDVPITTGIDIPDSCVPALAVVAGMSAQFVADLKSSSRKWGVIYRQDFRLPTKPAYRGRIVCWKGGAVISFGQPLIPLDQSNQHAK